MDTSVFPPTAPNSERVPLVSVWLITYNHEPYIAQAIEGVLMQKTTFAVELVIGEDCSSDRTREIVLAYKEKYPDRIKLFLSPENLGMVPVLEPTFAMCRGKYVAMLDGDDYWTDSQKLQKQIDLMEADATCNISFHSVQVYDESSGRYTLPPHPAWSSVSQGLDLHEFIHLGNPIYTVSAIFRRLTPELPAYYYQLPYPDLAIYYLVLAAGGRACYLPEVMGVYRRHAKGAFTGASWLKKRQDSLLFFNILQQHLPARYQQQLAVERQLILYELLFTKLKRGKMKAAYRYFQSIDWSYVPPSSVTFSRPHRYTAAVLRALGKLASK
ncbi:glycosyltransferase involved in cell wall biosynthesis [Hymenobacter luteus]|uniref:Glycosyltransferase involved in cell wall biosynthesis n=2 Tax=Hymenobacter TaxID=89966 RepID=A0A7W9T1R9_9BACT|nr:MULTISPECIES: glycosyltransferase [Hymenobacter]MBB4600705.1 glycosyltransferase involved in cell wall biosynthesis [Hymenobacter latericoloratus]MBB6059088.1 glycosyltransferase involved in cell wall biosynthesis [Hymenobacter luteus]